MPKKSRARLVSLAAAALLLVGTVGAASAANPNRSYLFSACWDDGLVSSFVGVVGTQTWSAFRVNNVSFGFENVAFGDAFGIPASRQGSEQSGWLAPQFGGGAFVGTLSANSRVVATGSIDEPSGGWSSLPAC